MKKTRRSGLAGTAGEHAIEAARGIKEAKETLRMKSCSMALQSIMDSGYALAHAHMAGRDILRLTASANRLSFAAGNAVRKYCVCSGMKRRLKSSQIRRRRAASKAER